MSHWNNRRCAWQMAGQITKEVKIPSEPEALVAWFGDLGLPLSRIDLEAGPLSQRLHAGQAEAGLNADLIETCHVRDVFKAMTVKTHREDARSDAQLIRLGWFRPVHCKSLPAQETRALLTARKLVQAKLHDVESSLRGILRWLGLKVGQTTSRTFKGHVWTMDQVRSRSPQWRRKVTTQLRSADLPLTACPIRWWPRADHGQKHDVGGRIKSQKGLDQTAAVTEVDNRQVQASIIGGRGDRQEA